MKRIDMAIELKTINTTGNTEPQGWFSTRKIRFIAQIFSTAITLWIGVEFYRFVQYLESAKGADAIISTIPTRPPGVEAFLPISALMSIRDWFYTGALNTIHPSSVIIFLAILSVAFLFKKGFCSWVCPVGLVSEMIANVGDKITGRRLELPKFVDYILRSIKYLLLSFFVYAVMIAMSPASIRQFIESPYNKIADVKMLKFFVEIDALGFWIIVGLFVLSIFLRGFWCRYFCPYGALVAMFSLIGPAKIMRNADSCISCGECARVCPSFINVDQVSQVVSDECSGCLDCIDVCPATGAPGTKEAGIKSLTTGFQAGFFGPVKRIPVKVWIISFLILFWGGIVVNKMVGPWENSISTGEYMYHTEKMDGGEYSHPGR